MNVSQAVDKLLAKDLQKLFPRQVLLSRRCEASSFPSRLWAFRAKGELHPDRIAFDDFKSADLGDAGRELKIDDDIGPIETAFRSANARATEAGRAVRKRVDGIDEDGHAISETASDD